MTVNLKRLILLAGDIAIFYLSLYITLFLRYGEVGPEVKEGHLVSFSILFALSIIVYYIVGFYELRGMKNDTDFGKRFAVALTSNFLIAILLFYFVPAFGIAPKTNLFIFFIIASSASYSWRTWWNRIAGSRSADKRLLLIGSNRILEEVAAHIRENPQLGYEVSFWMKDGLRDKEFKHLAQIIVGNEINLVVIPAHLKTSSAAARKIYQALNLGIEVIDLSELYETIFEKVPLAELEEIWFLENLAKSHRIHDAVKRPLEVILTGIIGIIMIPIAIIVVVAIKFSSPGSAFFTQVRVGKNGKPFIVWKFRTMVTGAEAEGPKWAAPKDKRITPLGIFLRRTHLDELPQLWNIFRGELSLVGPRPERPEFTATLEKEIPYYELRYLVRPGLTGSAQVNYRYGASLDDAYEKLQYDIYYLKHRSFFLDISILAKTVKRIFVDA